MKNSKFYFKDRNQLNHYGLHQNDYSEPVFLDSFTEVKSNQQKKFKSILEMSCSINPLKEKEAKSDMSIGSINFKIEDKISLFNYGKKPFHEDESQINPITPNGELLRDASNDQPILKRKYSQELHKNKESQNMKSNLFLNQISKKIILNKNFQQIKKNNQKKQIERNKNKNLFNCFNNANNLRWRDTFVNKSKTSRIQKSNSKNLYCNKKKQINFFKLVIFICNFLQKIMKSLNSKEISSHYIVSLIRELTGSQITKEIFIQEQFSFHDLQFIKSLFQTNYYVYQNNTTNENYFINKQNNNVYIKLSQSHSLDPSDNSTHVDESNLVSLKNYKKKNYLFCPDKTKNKSSRIFNNIFHNCSHQTSTTKFNSLAKIEKNENLQILNFNNMNFLNKSNVCVCSKNNHSKMNCICLKNKKVCQKFCRCDDCYNISENTKVVHTSIEAPKKINFDVFKNRFIEMKIDNQIKIYTKGCTCTKNNCSKNYCSCFKNGLACSPLCKCEQCFNKKDHLDPNIANKLYMRSSRQNKLFLKPNKKEVM